MHGHAQMHAILHIRMHTLLCLRWDEKMSAVTPNEDMFYSIGLLRSSTSDEWEELERQNEEILRFCHEQGIEFKTYLPHYTAQSDWVKHFGHKWDRFVELKRRYDPKSILSPGQQIFALSDEMSIRSSWIYIILSVISWPNNYQIYIYICKN